MLEFPLRITVYAAEYLVQMCRELCTRTEHYDWCWSQMTFWLEMYPKACSKLY